MSSNREEALRFAQTDNFDTAFHTIIARLAPGALAIVRDGARGCELRVGDSLTCVPGFEVKAVDSNGAGDAHAGVFLAVLATGRDPKTAAQRANAAAAIAVTRYGPATSPDAAEIDAFMTSRGYTLFRIKPGPVLRNRASAYMLGPLDLHGEPA